MFCKDTSLGLNEIFTQPSTIFSLSLAPSARLKPSAWTSEVFSNPALGQKGTRWPGGL